MTDSHGHEHDPDPAALDELMRAFTDDDVDPSTPTDAALDASVDEMLGSNAPTQLTDVSEQFTDDVDPTVEDADPDESSGEVHEQAEETVEPESVVVISLDDDDLPDPVYIEGSLDGDSSRSIVFIDDDDTADAVAPEANRDLRRGIEPRLRERRVAIRRAASRRRLKWVALAAAVVVVVVGGLALLGSPLFAIKQDQVSVTGAVYTDDDMLAAVIDDLVGTPVLVVDANRAEEDLEAIPWVDEAEVRTDFPHAVSIEIREREALATYRGPDGRFRVLDRDGRVLDVLDKHPFAYMEVGGPDPVDLDAGEFAPRGYAAASELVKNLTGSVRGQVEIIEVTGDGSRLLIRLTDGSEVRFGEARDLLAKLVRLETVLTRTPEREPGVIDVSTSEVTL